jgi:predicted nucleic acid-binding protein
MVDLFRAPAEGATSAPMAMPWEADLLRPRKARAGADFADALMAAAAQRGGCDEVVTFDKSAALRLGWRLIR